MEAGQGQVVVTVSGHRPRCDPSHCGCPATCRLIDGTNITTEDEHMWLIPFSPGLDHVVTIRFDRAESIAGLRFWNYNKSPEDTYRGVSQGPQASELDLDEQPAWPPERHINPRELSRDSTQSQGWPRATAQKPLWFSSLGQGESTVAPCIPPLGVLNSEHVGHQACTVGSCLLVPGRSLWEAGAMAPLLGQKGIVIPAGITQPGPQAGQPD